MTAPVEAAKFALGPTENPAVELRGASLALGGRPVLDDLSLQVAPGAKLSLVGESSCGKSSILKTMVGLIKPDHGSALLFGQDLATAGQRKLNSLRRRVGMQFQAGAMFDSLTVLDNLRLAAEESARWRDVKPADTAEAMALLEQVGLDRAARLKPSELSGGMRKRAALARALIVQPELAIFDEPTAGLDPVTSAMIVNLLNSLSGRGRAAMILAAGDVDVARRFSDDMIILRLGRIQARGRLDELLANDDPYVRNFLTRHSLTLGRPDSPRCPGRPSA
jgi:phospholipid/cholesterol/gamma-HCH transport system ATP-binding protein